MVMIKEDTNASAKGQSGGGQGTAVSTQPSESEGAGPGVFEGVQAHGIPSNEEGRGVGEAPRSDGGSVSEVRYESQGAGSGRMGGVEPGNPSGDIRESQRLDTPSNQDIILKGDEDLGNTLSATARFDANLLAIKTLKDIQSEGRRATPAEQAILAKYSGFGASQFAPAFRQYFGREYESWERRKKELNALISEEELRAIEGSRLNAFYTTPTVIKAMWNGLTRLGVANLNQPHILEPSAGSGRFFGFQPVELSSRSQRTAIELDTLTGGILKQLYPQAEVYVTGFESAPLPKDSYDVAISNVPFGNYPVFDRSFKKGRLKLTKQIHNYFFAKTLEKLRPGGILAFVTSHGTLDAPTHKDIRMMLAEEADFLGAVRLPMTAFPDTEVCTDIIYMRKRQPGDPQGDKSWTDTQEVTLQAGDTSGYHYPVKVDINQYFIEHPEMVLGQHSVKGSMRGSDQYTVEPMAGDLGVMLAEAIDKLPQGIIQELPPLPPRSIHLDSDINVRENARVIDEQGIVRIKQGGMLVKGDYSEAEQNRIKDMLRVRDAAKAVLTIQLQDGTDQELSELQARLNLAYNIFAKQHGALRNKTNRELMKGDPDEPFILALEQSKPPAGSNGKTTASLQEWEELVKAPTIPENKLDKLKMPLFSGRTIHGLGRPTIKNEEDALAFCYNETGRVDLDRIATLLGKLPDAVTTTLSAEGMIFKNPVGDWETADKYLSGDVRDKLKVAELAASANVRYEANVAALRKVQPVDLKPSEIAVCMGAPWIPASDVNNFISEICQVRGYRRHDNNTYFFYTPSTGDWTLGDKIEGSETAMRMEWGTNRMPANKLLEHILNGRMVEVNDKVEGEDGKEKSVRNVPETIAAQEKAKAIEQKFETWIWEDEERAERLLGVYNETFNNMRTRQFDGSHQALPGMTEEWAKRTHSHQKDAIWRVVQDRTTLLAHEVGFGKTLVMAASGMELRRLGLSRKNLFVVPKPTRGQFQNQFAEFYPYANILAPSDNDFSEANRSEFVSRIATGDWDGVVLTYDQFRRIPLRPETEARFIQDQIDIFAAALYDAKQEPDNMGQYYRRRQRQDTEKKKTQKQIEEAIKKLQVKLQVTMAKIGDKNDKTIYFDDLGVDQLYVDEADNFKNLQFATNMGRLKGLPNTDSQRAWDMYSKTRFLQEQGKGHGVVFATGTPVANTIAEMYTMMRYLQEEMLESRRIQHFDAWAKTFGRTTESLEQTAAGTYRMTQRFSKFNNTPELSQIWQQVADIRVADEVPGMVKLRPRVVDDQGKAKRTVIAIAPDDALMQYMANIVERADNMKNVDPKDDNMLKLSSDARKAALDVRMVNPSAPGNPTGKVAIASKNIARIYRETEPDKGIQLVFLDIGTPKAKDKIEDSEAPVAFTDDEETEEELRLLRDVYAVIRDNLKANGIPDKEIAFIHDAKTDTKKKELYRNLNNGDVRVVIGSTNKLGTGVNIQERAAALHHLDAPWRPRDIEQREGRIVRQGNIIYGPKLDLNRNVVNPGKGVRIYTYVTEKSFDGFMWQAQEVKSKAIKAIMRRDNPPRNIEDIDSFTMSASEAKAIASGNPDVMKAATLKNSITRLLMLRASNLDARVRARVQMDKLPATIQQLADRIGTLEEDSIKSKAEGEFALTVNGKLITERPVAAEELKIAIEQAPPEENMAKLPNVGSYKGFDIKVRNMGAWGGYTIVLTNPDNNSTYTLQPFPYNELSTGVLTRVENKVKVYIPNDLDVSRKELDQNRRNLASYEKQVNIPFEYDAQLKGMEVDLARIERKLQGQNVEDTPSDNYAPLPEEEMAPEYHFGAKEPETLPAPVAMEINPEAEIAAVQQEVSPVETTLEVKKPTVADLAKTIKAVADMAEPAKPVDLTATVLSSPIPSPEPIPRATLNGYVGFYKGKRYETYADTSYHAQQQIAKEHGIKTKDAWQITVILAEKEGQPVIHRPEDIESMAGMPEPLSEVVTEVQKANKVEEQRLEKMGGTGKMKLLTKELAAQFPKLLSTEKVPETDKVVIAKFFHPFSQITWYAVEYDPNDELFFGYVDNGPDSEWGYFSLREMSSLKVKGLGMERDLYFKPQKIKDVRGLEGRFVESATEIIPALDDTMAMIRLVNSYQFHNPETGFSEWKPGTPDYVKEASKKLSMIDEETNRIVLPEPEIIETKVEAPKTKKTRTAKPRVKAQVVTEVKKAGKPKTKPVKARKPKSKPVKVRKAKPKIKQVPRVSRSEAQERQEERTPQSQLRDLARTNKTVIAPSSPRVATWMKRPGSMDVRGIDTASQVKVKAKRKALGYKPKKRARRRSTQKVVVRA